jgi:hypothetical protein
MVALTIVATLFALILYFGAVLPVRAALTVPPTNDNPYYHCAGETSDECIFKMDLWCEFNAGGPGTWNGFWCRATSYLGCHTIDAFTCTHAYYR